MVCRIAAVESAERLQPRILPTEGCDALCRLRIPRRPAWTEEQSPEQIDVQERAAFLAWRRALAAVEEAERLVLTPFEKNLEVWRQLWRVVERSHIVVQVGRRPIRKILQCCHAYDAPQEAPLRQGM